MIYLGALWGEPSMNTYSDVFQCSHALLESNNASRVDVTEWRQNLYVLPYISVIAV
jgi:hypothetical protein